MTRPVRQVFGCFLITSALVSCGGGGGGDSAPPVNRLPQAVISVTNTSGYAPLSVDFDGSASTDSDGSIATYTWHMDDGSSYAGRTASHTYSTFGKFSATLTVTDDDGASSSTSVTIDVYAQAAGIYDGDVCSDVTFECFYAWGMVSSDHRVYLEGYDYGLDEWNRAFSGSIAVDEDAFTGTLQAELFGSSVFLDGSQLGSVTVNGGVSPQSDIDGSYSGVGDQGGLGLFYDSRVDSPASLTKLIGTWSYSDGLGYTDTMTVDESGNFNSIDTDGCAWDGQFALMDEARNEYDVTFTQTCPLGAEGEAWDGFSTGLAFVDQVYDPDTWIYIWYTPQEGPNAGRSGYWFYSRPGTSGITTNGSNKGYIRPIRTPRRSR